MKRGQTGFTLTEVLVVVTIVAILLGVGVPSYKYITNSYRLSAEMNSLVGDLMYARAEAIKEGQPVAVCVSSDGLTCSGAFSWQNGWIVFPDPNGAGAADSPPASILHVQATFTSTDTFAAPAGANPVSSFVFNREGFAQASNGVGFGATQLDLQDQTQNNAWTRCMSISAQGNIQVEPATAPILTFVGVCP
ncbi:MAG TPA: GspH/FimT family pseudopilin [Steroidobacteraceae bacterium]|nr:GspH/FimT family pseudopilin [Steroidobacteraceae bacterium]